jgi:hypothetical protein
MLLRPRSPSLRRMVRLPALLISAVRVCAVRCLLIRPLPFQSSQHGACCVGRCRPSLRCSCRSSLRLVFFQFLLHGACGFVVQNKRDVLQFLLSFGFLVLTSNTFWD